MKRNEWERFEWTSIDGGNSVPLWMRLPHAPDVRYVVDCCRGLATLTRVTGYGENQTMRRVSEIDVVGTMTRGNLESFEWAILETEAR